MTADSTNNGAPPLAGRRALVTGGARGIGLAVATAMLAQGARVALFDRDAGTLVTTMREQGFEQRPDVIAIEGAVTEGADVDRAVAAVCDAFGGIDLLVNNAGLSCVMPTVELPEERWQEVLDVNLTGVFLCSQRAARRMIPDGGGAIVNIASIWGMTQAPERVAYCVTKAGVISMTKVLAVEWAKSKVRVNAVAPGYTRTGMIQALVDEGKFDLAAIERRTPQGRMMEPADIADAVCFLCGPHARGVTGHVLAVDGGWTAYGFL